MSEDKTRLAEQIDRAARARDLLENPLLVEYFDGLDRTLWEQFKATDIADKDRLSFLRMLEQAQQNFTAHFRATIANGQMAEHDLALIEKRESARRVT